MYCKAKSKAVETETLAISKWYKTEYFRLGLSGIGMVWCCQSSERAKSGKRANAEGAREQLEDLRQKDEDWDNQSNKLKYKFLEVEKKNQANEITYKQACASLWKNMQALSKLMIHESASS